MMLYRSQIVLAALLTAATAQAETVTFTIDATAQVKPISRFIYGINSTHGIDNTIGGVHRNLTARREGGNRWTAYNWVNNASNAGSDYIFQNDNYLGGGDTPGGAVIPAIDNARQANAALLLTIPIQGYVAADKKPPGDVHNSDDYLNTRFHQERAVKGKRFTLTPSSNTKLVYQDEFVNWVKKNYPYSQKAGAARPIWFALDNEPDLWAETHPEIHPDAPTYAELVSKGASYAAGIKAVAPHTLVFGPVSYGWYGYVRLQGAPDANDRDFLSFYLKQMKAQGDAAGKRLLDVLDLHWYPEVRVGNYQKGILITSNNTTDAVVASRVQAPRSLWDPNFEENSWIVKDVINEPIQLIPRMLNKIANTYPGTRLAFTEYNYGAGGHISGGIAQADALGIFGKFGVFAAMQWPLHHGETFVAGAFKMYRDYDGAKGTFGDTSVKATTSSIEDTSIYASRDSVDPKRMVVVVINKTGAAIKGRFTLTHAAMTMVNAYKLTEDSATPQTNGNPAIADSQFNYTLPAYSVNTLVLSAP
jgi:hypothetical protein